MADFDKIDIEVESLKRSIKEFSNLLNVITESAKSKDIASLKQAIDTASQRLETLHTVLYNGINLKCKRLV